MEASQRSGYCSVLLQMNSKLQCRDPSRLPAIGRPPACVGALLQKNPHKNVNRTRNPRFRSAKDLYKITENLGCFL